MPKESTDVLKKLREGTYLTYTKGQLFSIANIEQIVSNENTKRMGQAQIDLYTKKVNATNKGLAKLIVFPDNSGIFFKETAPYTNEYVLNNTIVNVSDALTSARETSTIHEKSGALDFNDYRYKNSLGNLKGGYRRSQKYRIRLNKKYSKRR